MFYLMQKHIISPFENSGLMHVGLSSSTTCLICLASVFRRKLTMLTVTVKFGGYNFFCKYPWAFKQIPSCSYIFAFYAKNIPVQIVLRLAVFYITCHL